MADPGLTNAAPDTPVPIDGPPGPWPFPGERPLGSDEPSAPVDVPAEAPAPGTGPDVPPGDPAGPDLRV